MGTVREVSRHDDRPVGTPAGVRLPHQAHAASVDGPELALSGAAVVEEELCAAPEASGDDEHPAGAPVRVGLPDQRHPTLAVGLPELARARLALVEHEVAKRQRAGCEVATRESEQQNE